MNILVINAGSSTLKFALFTGSNTHQAASGKVEWNGSGSATLDFHAGEIKKQKEAVQAADYAQAVRQALQTCKDAGVLQPGEKVDGIGHRVVHGGEGFRESVRMDSAVRAAIEELSELAPLHNPPALQAIDAVSSVLPDVPSVAVFDTAFHASLPPHAYLYPVPLHWYKQWGVRRFGFHGISHDYCSQRAGELLGRDRSELRIVVCHLGNGCSATAVMHGKSVATTMGFTPLEGLMMGTRSGSIDPGLVLWLQQQKHISAHDLEKTLNHESGLLGISGVSSDYREVEEAAAQGNERARLALDLFAERVCCAIGALAVTMGGADTLVFTAGIGENAASLRQTVCERLSCLGFKLDAQRNRTSRPDADVSAGDSAGRILVLHTQEELLIAREVKRLLGN